MYTSKLKHYLLAGSNCICNNNLAFYHRQQKKIKGDNETKSLEDDLPLTSAPTSQTLELPEIMEGIEDAATAKNRSWASQSLGTLRNKTRSLKFSKYSLNRKILSNTRVALLSSDRNSQL